MPAKYANVEARESLGRRIENMEECKKLPQAWEKIRNKDKFNADLQRHRNQLEAMTPPETTGIQKDHLKKRIAQLQTALSEGNEAKGITPMPSHAEMYEPNSEGVGRHMSWETYWKTHNLDVNGKVIEVDPRKGQRAGLWECMDLMRTYGLEREVAGHPGVASLEAIRPNKHHIPLADLRGARSYGLSEQARANYDEVFPNREPLPVEVPVDPRGPKKYDRRARRNLKNPCQQTKANGEQCKGAAVKGQIYCQGHLHKIGMS